MRLMEFDGPIIIRTCVKCKMFDSPNKICHWCWMKGDEE